MSEFKRQAWVARDMDGALWLYEDEKPRKRSEGEWVSSGVLMEQLDDNLFPSAKWEDEEPTEVEIIIKPKKR